jgi:hypothetical protein
MFTSYRHPYETVNKDPNSPANCHFEHKAQLEEQVSTLERPEMGSNRAAEIQEGDFGPSRQQRARDYDSDFMDPHPVAGTHCSKDDTQAILVEAEYHISTTQRPGSGTNSARASPGSSHSLEDKETFNNSTGSLDNDDTHVSNDIEAGKMQIIDQSMVSVYDVLAALGFYICHGQGHLPQSTSTGCSGDSIRNESSRTGKKRKAGGEKAVRGE